MAAGIGTFICGVLEHTEMNVWIARGTGALVAAVAGLAYNYFIRKKGIEMFTEPGRGILCGKCAYCEQTGCRGSVYILRNLFGAIAVP